jgi:hypothetical protein
MMTPLAAIVCGQPPANAGRRLSQGRDALGSTASNRCGPLLGLIDAFFTLQGLAALDWSMAVPAALSALASAVWWVIARALYGLVRRRRHRLACEASAERNGPGIRCFRPPKGDP